MKTIFEKSKPCNRAITFKKLDIDKYEINKEYTRKELNLPNISEIELVRHYMELSNNAFGVDNGFYPLGSCTMKYNPKINEEISQLENFSNIHPKQNIESCQGCLEIIEKTENYLCEITGMDAISLQPCAGAHGEYTSLLLIKNYHESNGDFKRKKIIVPDSAHGTNPASAIMTGFEVVCVKSDDEKGVDIEQLSRSLVMILQL